MKWQGAEKCQMPSLWRHYCWQNHIWRNILAKPMMILIAGPYRSGTGDDPEKIKANVDAMEAYALPIFRMGHIPCWENGSLFPWFTWQGQSKSAMKPSMKFSIPSRKDSGKMRCCITSWRRITRRRPYGRSCAKKRFAVFIEFEEISSA